MLESGKHACCPSSCSSKISLKRTWWHNCHEGTTNQYAAGFKEGLWVNFSSSRPAFRHWKPHGLSGWSDAAMLSCHLCMDSWLIWKHSVALDQAAPVPGIWNPNIVVWRREFIVMVIEIPSTILRKDNSHDSGRWHGEIRKKTISGRLSGWNLRRHCLEYVMHLPDVNYGTWYSSYRLSQYAEGYDGLGTVLRETTFQDWPIELALGNDGSMT